MSFRVGQPVMCVNATVGPGWIIAGTPLEEGKVYTVRSARDDLKDERTDKLIGPAVQLVENTIHRHKWPKEQFWMAERFRALDDVSVTEEEHVALEV